VQGWSAQPGAHWLSQGAHVDRSSARVTWSVGGLTDPGDKSIDSAYIYIYSKILFI
jgi:hypothetical protein